MYSKVRKLRKLIRGEVKLEFMTIIELCVIIAGVLFCFFGLIWASKGLRLFWLWFTDHYVNSPHFWKRIYRRPFR